MQISDFCKLLGALTGKAVKNPSPTDTTLLELAVQNDDAALGCSQFNELLLLANKDRVEAAFFRYFFGTDDKGTCKVRDLPQGVERFRKTAMLRFGNFIYAYRQLSRLPTREALLAKLGEVAKTPVELLSEFKSRHAPTLTPELIDKEDTHYVGYLTSQDSTFDYLRVNFLKKALDAGSWDERTKSSCQPSRASSMSSSRRCHFPAGLGFRPLPWKNFRKGMERTFGSSASS